MKKIMFLFMLCSFSVISFGQIKESQAIDNIFKEWDKADAPGGIVGVFKDGKLIYTKGYGMANLEYNIPNSPSSVFRIASISKQFTAACIILLSEEGKLNLDDTVKSIFPNFPTYTEKITIRHLLNHTSGLRDYIEISYLKGLQYGNFYTNADIMKWLVNQENLNFTPGEQYLYCNSGYWLLGQIVNKVSGMNMADFAQKEIFKPLGMNNTQFYNDHNRIVKNRATGYAPDGEGKYKISMTTLDMIGSGGMLTTIYDIKKWEDAFYNSTVLSKTFWQEMTKQGILNNGEVIDYASGLYVEKYRGLKAIRHGGSYVGYKSELLKFPEEKLSIAIFANRRDAIPFRKSNQIADILLENKFTEKEDEVKDIKEEIAKPIQEFGFEQLIGNYEISPGYRYSIRVKNDTINLFKNWNQSIFKMIKVTGNTFRAQEDSNINITFSSLKKNLAQTLTYVQDGFKTVSYRKKVGDLSSMNLNDYLGSYYSKELDATYNFRIDNGILKLGIDSKVLSFDCFKYEIDQFTMDLGLVKFKRKGNKVSGFELDSERVKGLKFYRQ